MRFRKKPVVVEATRFTNGNGEELAKWCGGTFHPTAKPGYTSAININTLEGIMQAKPGDWIIRGVKGEFYPCKPEIFDATYELADADKEALEHFKAGFDRGLAEGR